MVGSSSGRWIFSGVTAGTDFETERAKIERRLDDICSTCLAELPSTIADAVKYGLKSPGKRLRPLLLVFAYRAAGGARDASLLACAPQGIPGQSLLNGHLPGLEHE